MNVYVDVEDYFFWSLTLALMILSLFSIAWIEIKRLKHDKIREKANLELLKMFREISRENKRTN